MAIMSDSRHPTAPSSSPSAEIRTSTPAAPGPQKSLLAVFAMLTGLVGLLTAIVAAIYARGFGAVMIVALALGVAGVALGTVALGLRRRPFVAAVIGTATGACAAILVIVLLLTGVVGTIGDTLGERGADGRHDGSGGAAAAGEGLRNWPANMATGGVVYGEGLQPVESEAPEDGAEPAEREIDVAADGADIQLYVDYRCPACGVFERTNGATLEQLVSDGAATLEVHPLTFLDGVSPDAYSSRAASAVACVVEQQPEDAWAAHARLFELDVQPPETEPGLTNEQIAEQLDDATGGLTERTRSCIVSEHFVDFSIQLQDWLSLHPVPRAQDPGLKATSTPFAVVNGELYQGPIDDPAEFRSFLEQQGVSLG